MKNFHPFVFFLIFILISVALSFSAELRTILLKNIQVDTIGHCIGFFILTWLLSYLGKIPTKPLTYTLITYAAFSELGQYYLGFRNGEVKDFIADVIGILLFVILKWLWLLYGKRARV